MLLKYESDYIANLKLIVSLQEVWEQRCGLKYTTF